MTIWKRSPSSNAKSILTAAAEMAEPTDSRVRLLQALQDNDIMQIYGYCYDNILRHTGILIKFTNCRDRIITQFTIDVSDVNGLLQRMQCVIWNCEANIVVNEIAPGQQNMYRSTDSPIRTFLLCEEAGRNNATRYVNRLLEPTIENYQLFFNNCRDHTDRAIRVLCCDGQCCPRGREEALRNTQARRFEDSDYIKLGGLALAATLIGCFVAYKYITRSS